MKKSAYTIKVYSVILLILWTASFALIYRWSCSYLEGSILEEARITARVAHEKDVIYRRWNAGHGSVYVPVTEETRPSRYLSHIPERDIVTPSGIELTLINPAYMTRQVHELSAKASNLLGHITSLNPIRSENAPDEWEARALESFKNGQMEVSSVAHLNGLEYMRLMRPLVAKKECLRCHAKYGFKEGDVRGGISVAVPMEPLWAIYRSEKQHIFMMGLLLWGAGIAVIIFGSLLLTRSEKRRSDAQVELERSYERVEEKVDQRTEELKSANTQLADEVVNRKLAYKEKEKLVKELQESINEIRTLKGLIPICASCKKIRDDQGLWSQVENYLRQHSEAEFTHGYCPDCMVKFDSKVRRDKRP